MSLIPSQPSDPLKVSQHWYLAIILHGCYKTHNANRFSKILNAIQMNSINHPVTAAIKCFRSTHYVMLFYNLQWSQPVNQNSPPILSPTQQLTLFGMSTNFWLQKTTPDSIFPNIIVPMSCTPEERGVKRTTSECVHSDNHSDAFIKNINRGMCGVGVRGRRGSISYSQIHQPEKRILSPTLYLSTTGVLTGASVSLFMGGNESRYSSSDGPLTTTALPNIFTFHTAHPLLFSQHKNKVAKPFPGQHCHQKPVSAAYSHHSKTYNTDAWI